MKKIIRFSRGFLPAAIISVLIIAAGIAGYFVKGGFNLGVDFQAGFIQEAQLAPTAFTVQYAGRGDATINFTREAVNIVISGANIDGATHSFQFVRYPTLNELRNAMQEQVEGLTVTLAADAFVRSEYLVQSALGNPELGETPFTVHYLEPDAAPVPIDAVREALSELDIASIQVLGAPNERRFLIRIDAEEGRQPAAAPSQEAETESQPAATVSQEAEAENQAAAAGNEEPEAASQEAETPAVNTNPPAAGSQMTLDEKVRSLLEKAFGEGGVAITRSDFVGSRFSKQLADQAGLLLSLTLVLILIYASIRFKPQFAIGAVLAIAHDALIMVAFIAWSRMEFNTTTIAAILTILGYSINDTIVIFDRVKETRLLYPDDSFSGVLDRAVTETLSRTIITTLTTMLAVLSLYIFTTRGLYQNGLDAAEKIRLVFTEHNNMKDFALSLLIGMISGVYSTIFIACGWTLFWEKNIKKLKTAKLPANAAALAGVIAAETKD